MPLFGNNHTTGPATTTEPTGHNVLHRGEPAYDGTETTTGHHGHTGPGPAIGAAAGGAAGHYEGHTAAGTALGAAAGHHHAKTHPTAEPGMVGNGGHANGGAPVAGQQNPTGPMNHGTGPVSAGEKKFIGKMEHAAGNVLCSSTLKARGIEKEREAEMLKMQAAELNAAEHLEGQASAHRERAVASGAHPHNMRGGAGAMGTNQNMEGQHAGGAQPHHMGGGAGAMGTNQNMGGQYAGGAPVGDTYGAGVPPNGPGGGMGPQGGAALR